MRHLELGFGRGVSVGVLAALYAGVACGSGPAHGGRIGGKGGVSGSLGDGGDGGSTLAGKGGASGAGSDMAGASGDGASGETGEGGSAGSAGSGGNAPGQGVGEDCSQAEPCRSGLTCENDACEPAHSTGAGQPCVIGAECEEGLQCSGGRCFPEGDSGKGEECLLDTECESGLRCSFSGLAAACSPTGKGDVGRDCETNSDCYQGLACAESKCAPQPAGLPVFNGVECEPGSNDDVRAYFEVPGAKGADLGDFFRLPFPNDIRRTEDGLDLKDFPTPGPAALGIDAVKLYVDAIVANDDGWGAYPTVTFRFSGNVKIPDPNVKVALAWVDVTPGEPYPWASVGLSWYNNYGRNQYLCENAVSARRPRGAPLTPDHTYAVYLTTDIVSVKDEPIAIPPHLVSLLAGTAPSDKVLKASHAAYAPFRAYLTANNIAPTTILNAAVFTVGGTRNTMAAVASAIAQGDAPTAERWTKCDDGVESPCPDRAGDRACGAGTDTYDEYHALVSLPIFQKGEPPYLTPADGGGIVVEDELAEQPTSKVCLALTVPKGTAPTDGWPLVVYAHGTGGSFRDHVSSSVAGALSDGSVKLAVLGIDQVEHGPRRGDSTVEPDQLFFNFLNPSAARGNPIQGAADQLSLARLAETMDGNGDAPKIDKTKLFFFGHSQGSTEGSLMLPYGDGYKAAVLSGNGASLMDALLTKTKPTNIKNLYPIAIADLAAAGDSVHPVLSLLQQWIDPADPLNFARYVAKAPLAGHTAKHVFQTYGLEDSYSPPGTLATYALAGELTHVSPEREALRAGLETVEPPLSGNEQASTITAGVRQYDPEPSGKDGHFVVFNAPQANADMVRFFTGAVSGIPSIGD